MKQILGSVSSLIVGACCLGLTPLLSGLTAVGLGFLINDLILLPLLALFLGFTLWAIFTASKRHKRKASFYIGVVASTVAFGGLWLFKPLSYAGFAMLIGIAIWDFLKARKGAAESQIS